MRACLALRAHSLLVVLCSDLECLYFNALPYAEVRTRSLFPVLRRGSMLPVDSFFAGRSRVRLCGPDQQSAVQSEQAAACGNARPPVAHLAHRGFIAGHGSADRFAEPDGGSRRGRRARRGPQAQAHLQPGSAGALANTEHCMVRLLQSNRDVLVCTAVLSVRGASRSGPHCGRR